MTHSGEETLLSTSCERLKDIQNKERQLYGEVKTFWCVDVPKEALRTKRTYHSWLRALSKASPRFFGEYFAEACYMETLEKALEAKK